MSEICNVQAQLVKNQVQIIRNTGDCDVSISLHKPAVEIKDLLGNHELQLSPNSDNQASYKSSLMNDQGDNIIVQAHSAMINDTPGDSYSLHTVTGDYLDVSSVGNIPVLSGSNSLFNQEPLNHNNTFVAKNVRDCLKNR